jgi:hypothetical protein
MLQNIRGQCCHGPVIVLICGDCTRCHPTQLRCYDADCFSADANVLTITTNRGMSASLHGWCMRDEQIGATTTMFCSMGILQSLQCAQGTTAADPLCFDAAY